MGRRSIACGQSHDLTAVVVRCRHDRERRALVVEPSAASLEVPLLPGWMSMTPQSPTVGLHQHTTASDSEIKATRSVARTACAPMASPPSCQRCKISRRSAPSRYSPRSRSVTAKEDRSASVSHTPYATTASFAAMRSRVADAPSDTPQSFADRNPKKRPHCGELTTHHAPRPTSASACTGSCRWLLRRAGLASSAAWPAVGLVVLLECDGEHAALELPS